jgi:cell division protein FtsB|tara:strand:- start:117 stop:377 length:261 start_codon:yes stop_codon:yes gene_type:complete
MKFINTKTTIATIDRELAAYKEGAQIMNHFLLIASDRIKEQKQTINELQREVADLKYELAAQTRASYLMAPNNRDVFEQVDCEVAL